jgi:peptide/nickel transport system permease protein
MRALAQFLLRRAAHAALLLLMVSLLAFLLVEMAPGNFFSEMQMDPQISPEAIAALRSQYGVDQPVYVRYGRWLRSVAAGEFGYSFAYGMPVIALVWPRARNTLVLAAAATLLAWLVALPLGVWIAASRRRLAARAASAGVSAMFAVPDVILALGALVLAAWTRWLPAGGMFSAAHDGMGDAVGASRAMLAADLAKHLVLPSVVLAIGMVPILGRHIRAAMEEVLDAGFMRAAVGLGISRGRVLFRYGLRAAANPLITLAGFSVAGLLSASLLVEIILSWPGLGPLMLEAILARDLYVVVGVVMLSSFFLIGGNFLADVALYATDPRIRVGKGAAS